MGYAFPAETADMFNYAMSTVYVPETHVIIDFDSPVDPEGLAKAFRLCLVGQPILACRFLPRTVRARWEVLSSRNLDDTILLRVEKDHTDLGRDNVAAFMAEELDVLSSKPQVLALLVQRPEGDRLVIKVGHHVADGFGALSITYLVAAIYRRLQGNPDFVPEISSGSRSYRQIYDGFSRLELIRILGRYFQTMVRNIGPRNYITFPSNRQMTGSPQFLLKHFSGSRFNRLKAYVEREKCTINDLMMTAAIRAIKSLCGTNGSKSVRMLGTVDLRRRYKNGNGHHLANQPLCNLTGFFLVNLGWGIGANFGDTLRMVSQEMAGAKRNRHFGLDLVLGAHLISLPFPFAWNVKRFRRFFNHFANRNATIPGLTNVGRIDSKALNFSPHRVVNAVFVPPANRPPFTLFGLSGFEDNLTLSFGGYESAVPRTRIEDFFERIDAELPA